MKWLFLALACFPALVRSGFFSWMAFQENNCFTCWSIRSDAFFCNNNNQTGWCCDEYGALNCYNDQSVSCSYGTSASVNQYDYCIYTNILLCGTNQKYLWVEGANETSLVA